MGFFSVPGSLERLSPFFAGRRIRHFLYNCDCLFALWSEVVGWMLHFSYYLGLIVDFWEVVGVFAAYFPLLLWGISFHGGGRRKL